jgi:protein-disulfide isomerase
VRVIPLLKQVLETYPEQVKVVHKNFPLRNHKYARKAAAAALAADKQGKFNEMSEQLFKNARTLSDEKVGEIAGQLELNQEQFQKDWKDAKIANQINKDIRDGRQIGVRGTPTIFVSGRLLRQRSMDGFRTLIEKELEKKKERKN